MATLRELARQIVEEQHTMPAVLEALCSAMARKANAIESRGGDEELAASLDNDCNVLEDIINKNGHRFSE